MEINSLSNRNHIFKLLPLQYTNAFYTKIVGGEQYEPEKVDVAGMYLYDENFAFLCDGRMVKIAHLTPIYPTLPYIPNKYTVEISDIHECNYGIIKGFPVMPIEHIKNTSSIIKKYIIH